MRTSVSSSAHTSRPNEPLRVITFNLWVGHDPEARLEATIQALAALAPDLLLLQEVRGTPQGLHAAERISAALGWTHIAFARQTPASKGSGEDNIQGLAIASRYPLRRTEVTELPHSVPALAYLLLSAELDLLGRYVSVHCTHLHWRRDGMTARHAQMAAILAAMAAYGGDIQLLGGDLNASPDEAAVVLARGRLIDCYAAIHPGKPGVTWAKRNPATAEIAAKHGLKQDRRIDYLLVGPAPEVPVVITDCQVVCDAPRGDLWLSDHFGLMAELDIAGSAPLFES